MKSYAFTFLDLLKHNQINPVNEPSDYLVKLFKSKLTQIYHIIVKCGKQITQQYDNLGKSNR